LKIFKDISLRKYNTFGFDYRADCLISVKTEKEAISVLSSHKSLKNPLLVIGGGSNLLFTSDFKGTILRPEMVGIRIERQDKEYVTISAGAGVIWDNLVEWTVNKGYSGLENLSLIPGMVGASPVQNIGAFGVEAKDVTERVRAVSIVDGSVKEFSNQDCQFGYRYSIFKNELKSKYLVTRVYFKLSIKPFLQLGYGSLKNETEKLGALNLQNVRRAVINIRRNKLPDPGILGNAGSFFKNPVVSNSKSENLKGKYPDIPTYENKDEGVKLAAGWLIDQCGWKGKRIGDAGVHENQALVIVNYGNATGTEIYNLSDSIRKSVYEKFGIELEREVEVIGPI
jgi:UDP-N-acetylmuramate dehydrogenase